MNKKCNLCIKFKSIDNFSRNKRSKDGHANICKLCINEHHKKNKAKYLPRKLEYKKEVRKRLQQTKDYIIKEQKYCYKCKYIKPIGEFHKDAGCADGHTPKCKLCTAKIVRVVPRIRDKVLQKKYSRNNYYNCFIKHRYKLSKKDFDIMLKDQGYSCSICKVKFEDTEKSPCVDHDHITDKVRSLLCRHCNSGLGFFKENKDSLISAITYIEKYSK